NTHYIIIYNDYVLYGRRQEGEWETLINWQQSSFIKKNSQENKIAIKKSDTFTGIFINEQLIFEMDSLPNYGENTGFILFGNIMVKADFFLITGYAMLYNNKDETSGTEFLAIPGHNYLFESDNILDEE
ncbi:MAG: hypothetical protein JXB88_13150, partial [Spirochaetales bacterium]|nr:hypothetical protein [Spirochaetales bacterium]